MKYTKNKNKRIVARRSNGKFAKTPSLDRMARRAGGGGVLICPHCRRMKVWTEPVPDEYTCHNPECAKVIKRNEWL